MEHRPEVPAAEKREIGCDASMRSVRRRDAQDLPKEHAPPDDSAEFWAELGNLREYITCTHAVTVLQPFFVWFVALIVSSIQYCVLQPLTNPCYYATLPRSQRVA